MVERSKIYGTEDRCSIGVMKSYDWLLFVMAIASAR